MSLPFPANLPEHDYGRIIHAVRVELESAGNPAFVVAIVEADEVKHLSPMVFATIYPASDLARRLRRTAEPGQKAVIISRHASGERAHLAVLDPVTLRKLHEQQEIVEKTFADLDGPV